MFRKIKQKIINKKIEKMMKKNMEELEPLFRYREVSSVSYVADFILKNSSETKNLLDEKGFSYNMEDRVEKIALLQTEVSELIDAFKKGKGDDEEGEELADIIIRLMNIPCMYPEIETYITRKMLYLCEEDKANIITMFLYGVTKQDKISKVKFHAAYSMFKTIDILDSELIYLEYLYRKGQTIKSRNVEKQLEKIFITMSTIIALCELYASDILNKNLQDLVNEKMNKNHQRPFRYNISPELFS